MNSFGGILHPINANNQTLSLSMSQVFPSKECAHESYQNFEIVTNCKKSSNGPYIIAVSSNSENQEESILQAYKKYGEDFFSHLEGDFALALFDKQKNVLYLARDPLGKKSLYFALTPGYFLFATEIKQLLATGIVPQTLSGLGVASYFYFGFTPQDFTSVDSVHKLLPGHFLKIDLAHDMRINQYWSLSNALLTTQRAPKKEISAPTLPPHKPETFIKDLVKIVWQLDEPISDLNMARIYGKTSPIIDSRPPPFDATMTETKSSFSLSSLLARAPKWLQRGLIFPLTKKIYPNLLWRTLRSIDINTELQKLLPTLELFDSHERKRLSPTLYRTFDPLTFFERFHRLGDFKTKEMQFYYLYAKTKLPDSLLFQCDHLSKDSKTPYAQTDTLLESKEEEDHPFNSEWYDHPKWRELFSLLEEGRLVEEGLISVKWLHHHLGFPHLIEKTFKQLYSVLILEIWFRLFIGKPINVANRELSVKELLS